jgi:hypothetical protein
MNKIQYIKHKDVDFENFLVFHCLLMQNVIIILLKQGTQTKMWNAKLLL